MVAILTIVALVAAAPASAQTMIQFRYGPSRTTFSGGTTGGYETTSVGVTLRKSISPAWALSFEGDWGGQSNWSGDFLGGTSGTDSYWSLNLHRTWGYDTSNFSLFAGYVNLRSGTVFPGSPNQQVFRANGFRVGADYQRMLSQNWSLVLWGAAGVGLNGEYSWPGMAPTETTSAKYYEYGAAISYMFTGDWSLDLGYRVSYSSGGGSLNYSSFNATTPGFIIGITRMMP